MRIRFSVEVEGASSKRRHEQIADAESALSMLTPMLLIRQLTNDLVEKFYSEGNAAKLFRFLEDEKEIDRLKKEAEIARKRLQSKIGEKISKIRSGEL